MATCFPFRDKYLWLDEGEDFAAGVEERIEEAKCRSLRVTLKYLAVLFGPSAAWSSLPMEILQFIADYAAPVAADMRISWYDDEGHAKDCREKKFEARQCNIC